MMMNKRFFDLLNITIMVKLYCWPCDDHHHHISSPFSFSLSSKTWSWIIQERNFVFWARIFGKQKITDWQRWKLKLKEVNFLFLLFVLPEKKTKTHSLNSYQYLDNENWWIQQQKRENWLSSSIIQKIWLSAKYIQKWKNSNINKLNKMENEKATNISMMMMIMMIRCGKFFLTTIRMIISQTMNHNIHFRIV